MITGTEIRQKFLEYFQNKAHTIVKSASLIPQKDPTLLFTNAGMVQFKNYFTGEEKAPFPRAASSQKCVRAGGKHNDLENVGYTARHHTFFEMLGNFSFGDYFKEGAIAMAWEFLTEVLKLPKEKLWVTIHEGDPVYGIGPDEEARKLWLRFVPEDRLRAFPSKDNFWQMGDTGPCGPCSEVVIDQGPTVGCGRPTCSLECGCDRFLELWNLVFMQFERYSDGHLTPLPKPSIDTGMGLERITAVVQGVESNYDTDLFAGILQAIERLSQQPYRSKSPEGISFRVIADHIRAATFLISDGVLPSNEGRGYVLRRIMRRAMRHGKKLGIHDAFLFHLVDEVIAVMHDAYPELLAHRDMVRMVIANEEERFSETLNFGLRLWMEERELLKNRKEKIVPGEFIFKLYDTYGFPIDLTEEMARDEGFSIDREGFEKAMEVQRNRAREAWKGSGEEALKEIYRTIGGENWKTEFVGYDQLEAQGRILKIFKGESVVESAHAGDEVEILLDRTPFYGEAGGQEGDRGILLKDGSRMEIQKAFRPFPEVILHRGIVQSGGFRIGDSTQVIVDGETRQKTARNHTATHLLQAALRQVLGNHVKQAGSLVASDRLRFDFTHFSPLSQEEIDRVEEIVNAQIRDNRPVCISYLPYREAIEKGAIALFGEKYGDTVRLVEIEGMSAELCGGTHTHRSGDIGLFRIISETGVAAGVRRIEALTGDAAWKFTKEREAELRAVAQVLKAKPGEIHDKLLRLLNKQKEIEKSLRAMEAELSRDQSKRLIAYSREVKGIHVLSSQVEVKDPKHLREMADRLRDQIQSGIILLGAQTNGKAMLLLLVTPDLKEKYPAQQLIREVAKYVGGTGGGRPDMAQAGGPKVEGLKEALDRIFDMI